MDWEQEAGKPGQIILWAMLLRWEGVVGSQVVLGAGERGGAAGLGARPCLPEQFVREHLRAVTHKENCNNRAACDKTHCKCGEELSLNNKGHKICVRCRDIRVRLWRERHPLRYLEISRKSYAKVGRKGYERVNGERVYLDGA